MFEEIEQLTDAIADESVGSSTWITLRLLRDEQYHLLHTLGTLQQTYPTDTFLKPINRGQDASLPLELKGVPKCLHAGLRAERPHKRGCAGIDGGCIVNAPVILGLHAELFRWRRRNWVTKGRDILYFLLHKRKVVYVGRVQDLDSRIIQHAKDKVFDEVWYTGGEYVAKWIERMLIRELQPKYNIVHKPRRKNGD